MKLSYLATSIIIFSMSSANASFDPSTLTSAIQQVNTSMMQKAGAVATSAQSLIMRSNVSNYMQSAMTVANARTVAKVLAGGVVGALATYAVIEGTNYAVKTLMARPDGNISFTKPGESVSNNPAFTNTQYIWTFTSNTHNGTNAAKSFSPNPNDLMPSAFAYVKQTRPQFSLVSYENCRISDGINYLCDLKSSDPRLNQNGYFMLTKNTPPVGCGAGQMVVGGSCTNAPGQQQDETVIVPPDALGGALPVPDLQGKITPESLAQIINRINAQMATNPANAPIQQVTAADVSAAIPAGKMPTIGDITMITNPPAVASDPTQVKPDATTSPVTNTNSNTNTETELDLGPDPGIASPNIELEATPTAGSILSPILNMLPSYKTLSISGGSLSCPFNQSFRIDYFNRDFSLSSVCTFADQIAPLIRGAMTAMFGLLSIIIILGA